MKTLLFVLALGLIASAPSNSSAAEAPACKYPTEAIDVPDAPTPGTVALTFDDGPNPATTPHVLDVLKKYNIKATFFLVGSNVIGNEDIVRRTLSEGHNIGVHTWTHPHIPEISEKEMRREVWKTVELLKGFRNPRTRVMRFPFGESTCAAEKYVESLHYNIVGWHVDSCDWSYGEGLEKSECVPPGFQNQPLFKKNYQAWIDYQLATQKGGIILMHDAEPYEARHLEAEIRHLKAQGYKFVELDRGGLFPKTLSDHTGEKHQKHQ